MSSFTNNILVKEDNHDRELVISNQEDSEIDQAFQEVIGKVNSGFVDKENPLKPPSPKADSLAWTGLNTVEGALIPVSTKTFRQRPLFSSSKDTSVMGDQEWAHSLFRDSMRVSFYGDVKMDSWRDTDLKQDFMYNTAGGFALSENFEAEDVRGGGGKTVVGDDVRVEKADQTSHFLVSGDYDITNIGRDARFAMNISEFRGEWDELKDFFKDEVPEEEKWILGVSGFEQESYDSLRELREEIMERRERWEPITCQNIGYLDSDPYIIDSINTGKRKIQDLNRIDWEQSGHFSYNTDDSLEHETIREWMQPGKSVRALAYSVHREDEFEGSRYEKLEKATRELTELKWDHSDPHGYQHFDREKVLKSLEDIMDVQASLSSRTIAQDLKTGDLETHLYQAEELSDPDFDVKGGNEIGLHSETRCRLCGRYVDNVARYFRTVREIEERAEDKGIGSEALNIGFDIMYEF